MEHLLVLIIVLLSIIGALCLYRTFVLNYIKSKSLYADLTDQYVMRVIGQRVSYT